MNREIKFRALYRGDWYDIEELYLDNGKIFVQCFKNENFSPDQEHIKAIVEFTGLKDKNGKEIYEGDIILSYNNRIGKVIFNKCCFMLEFKDSDWYTLFTEPIEVVGNIFENPELLK